MFWLLRKISSALGQHWDMVQWAAGILWTAFGGGIMGWGVYVTHVLSAYAPLSWILAGFLGATIAALLFALVAKSTTWFAHAKWTRIMSGPGDGVNPLDDNFVRKRIKLNDFVLPPANVIHGKTFDQCELIGPANLLFTNGSTFDPMMFDVNYICVKNFVQIANVVNLDRCNVIRCRIFRCNILIPESDAHQFPVPVTWVSRVPSEFNFPVPWDRGQAPPPGSPPMPPNMQPKKPANEKSFPPAL